VIAAAALAGVLLMWGVLELIEQRKDVEQTKPPVDDATSMTPGNAAQSGSPTVIVSRRSVMGWWGGASWVQWEPGLDVPLRGGEQYLTLTIATRGSAVGTEPRPASGDGCGLGAELAPEVELTGEDGAVNDAPIGVTGPAHVLGGSQPGEELSTDNAEYQTIAAEALRSSDLEGEGAKLVQVVRSDLDGDSSADVLLVIERLSPGPGEPGDFAVVFWRRLVDGKVETQVLHKSVARRADEAGRHLVSTTRFEALLDINGDGFIELVASYRYGHSVGTSVLDLSGPEPTEALSANCPN
jgi:hypothetical protein